MKNLSDYHQSTLQITESTQRYTYTLHIQNQPQQNQPQLFRLDRNPQPWEGGPIPDGVAIGEISSSNQQQKYYVVFLELKSVTNPANTKSQIERASRQILSGIFHFRPYCRCHNQQTQNCTNNHGDTHHQNWQSDLGQIINNIQQYQFHEVRGTIILFHIHLQRTISPPPNSGSIPSQAQQGGYLGGAPICPKKCIPRFKIIYRTTATPSHSVTLHFSDLL